MGRYLQYYNTLTLAQLRRRQRINENQTTTAFQLAQNPYTHERGHRALVRLQRNARLLQAVVMNIGRPEL